MIFELVPIYNLKYFDSFFLILGVFYSNTNFFFQMKTILKMTELLNILFFENVDT